MTLLTSMPVLTVAAVVVALPSGAVRRAVAGGVVAALALASLSIAGGPDWRSAGLPASYLSITAGLLATGLAIPVWLMGGSLRRGEVRGLRAIIGGVAAGATVGLGGRVALPLSASGGMLRAVAVPAILIGVTVLLHFVLRATGVAAFVARIGQRRAAGDSYLMGSRHWDRRARWLLAGHLLSMLLVLAAWHLLPLLVGVVGAVVLGVVLDRRLGRGSRWPLPALAGLGPLALAVFLLIRVAGDVPLTLAALRDGPFSAAFELLCAVLLVLAAWPLLGLWPFQSVRAGPATPLVGAGLVAGLAVGIVPEGVAHWQPAFYPLAVLSIWYGAATRRDPLVLTGLGAIGLLSLAPSATGAGLGFVAGAVLLRLGEIVPVPDRLASAVRAGGLLASAVLLVKVLEGGLEAQTFYTVAGVLGLVVSAVGAQAGEFADRPLAHRPAGS